MMLLFMKTCMTYEAHCLNTVAISAETVVMI